ncbi:MAG: hypothetical protein HDQ88_06855, partial [Clostridia bacterium]|nr:hypothetical protein [Clostridia bacterium]
IYNGALRFDSDDIGYDDQKTVAVLATVKDGLSDGTDYTNILNIRIQPKLRGMDEYLPLNRVIFNLPTILRAYRPILISESELRPYDTTQRNARWSVVTIDEATDSQALIFTYSESVIEDLKANGVLLDDPDFIWIDGATYIYPMSGGKLRISLNVPEGISMTKDYESASNRSFAFPDPEDQQGAPVDHEVDDIEILDPFIPVLGINNIPSEIWLGNKYYLSPELDTGDGLDQETARWDDRVPSHSDVIYEITSGNDIASIDENGVITPKKKGNFKLKITVPSGVQEAYEWSNGVEFNPIPENIRSKKQVDFTVTRTIQVREAYEAETGDVIMKLFTNKTGAAGVSMDIPAGKWDVKISKPTETKVIANDGSGDGTTSDEFTVTAPNGSVITAVNTTPPPTNEVNPDPVVITVEEDEQAKLVLPTEGTWTIQISVPQMTKVVDNTGDGDCFTSDTLQLPAPTGAKAVAVNTSVSEDESGVEAIDPDPVTVTAEDNTASLTIPVAGTWNVSMTYPEITKVVDDYGSGDLTTTDELEIVAPVGATITATLADSEDAPVTATVEEDDKVSLTLDQEGTWNISVTVDDAEITTSEADEVVTYNVMRGTTVTATLVEAAENPAVTRVEAESVDGMISMNLPTEGTWTIDITVDDFTTTIDNEGEGDGTTADEIVVPIVNGATVTATLSEAKNPDAEPIVTEFTHNISSGNRAVLTLPSEGIWTIDVTVSESKITVKNTDGPKWFDGEAGFIVEVKSEYGQTLTGIMKAANQIDIDSMADVATLCSIGEPDQVLELQTKPVARKDIIGVEFTDEFRGASLDNFGWNFINLESVNTIPTSVTSLRNFLRNCGKFNQKLTIPSKVNGDRCLEGFLRGCSSFNQVVIIPDGIVGNHCFESFLRDCTSFNKPVFFPSNVEGKCCLYYALAGCTSLNSYVDLPKKVVGVRAMESMLRGCTSFNQPVFLPESISGKYNIAAFMFECQKMTSPVVLPDKVSPDAFENDVITFATFYRDTPITNGIKINGKNAEVLNSIIGDQGKGGFVPVRLMTVDTGKAPSRPANPYK